MTTDDPAIFSAPADEQLRAFVDEHREVLAACLDGLTEAQARARLVPSKTTLLGLVKHATFVELVWFDEAFTGRSRAEIGIPATPDESFELTDDDTIASVSAAYVAACDGSRLAAAGLGLDDVVTGNRRGPLPLRWIYLHMLRELAQHRGHADILREQILADAAATMSAPTVKPVRDGDARVLIAVLGRYSGMVAGGALGEHAVTTLGRRCIEAGLLPVGAELDTLTVHGILEDIGQRLRYAIGEYPEDPTSRPNRPEG